MPESISAYWMEVGELADELRAAGEDRWADGLVAADGEGSPTEIYGTLWERLWALRRSSLYRTLPIGERIDHLLAPLAAEFGPPLPLRDRSRPLPAPPNAEVAGRTGRGQDARAASGAEDGPGPLPLLSAAYVAVQQARAERDRLILELIHQSREHNVVAPWDSMPPALREERGRLDTREIHYLEQLSLLLEKRGLPPRTAERQYGRGQALRSRVETLLLTLSDEEFEAIGPNDGDPSARQFIERMQREDHQALESLRRTKVAGDSSS